MIGRQDRERKEVPLGSRLDMVSEMFNAAEHHRAEVSNAAIVLKDILLFEQDILDSTIFDFVFREDLFNRLLCLIEADIVKNISYLKFTIDMIWVMIHGTLSNFIKDNIGVSNYMVNLIYRIVRDVTSLQNDDDPWQMIQIYGCLSRMLCNGNTYNSVSTCVLVIPQPTTNTQIKEMINILFSDIDSRKSDSQADVNGATVDLIRCITLFSHTSIGKEQVRLLLNLMRDTDKSHRILVGATVELIYMCLLSNERDAMGIDVDDIEIFYEVGGDIEDDPIAPQSEKDIVEKYYCPNMLTMISKEAIQWIIYRILVLLAKRTMKLTECILGLGKFADLVEGIPPIHLIMTYPLPTEGIMAGWESIRNVYNNVVSRSRE